MTTAPPKNSVWKDKRDRQHGLYDRQREALQLYAKGITYREVAEEMGVAVGTASSYIGGAVRALGACDPQDAVRIAIRRGLIKDPQLF